jgi:hypothetical protein
VAKIVLVCPFCQKKVETDDTNVGRDGQCPACEKIFEITAPAASAPARSGSTAGAGWSGGANEFEYRDSNALVATIAVGVALLLLAGSTFAAWAPSHSRLADYVPMPQAVVLAASALCCAFFAFSALGGKSLMPALIISGAWGILAAIWAWAIHFFTNGIARDLTETSRRAFSLSPGLFLAMGAGLLVMGASLFAYRQVKAGSTFERLGFFMLFAMLLAIVLGFVIAGAGVRPAVAELAQGLQHPETAEERPPAGRPPRGRRPPAAREEPAEEQTRPERRPDTPPPTEQRPEEPPSDTGAVPFIPAEEEEDF